MQRYLRLSVPSGRAWLALRLLHRRLVKAPQFDRSVCWSVGALLVASTLRTIIHHELRLAHLPNSQDLRLLRWFSMSRRADKVRITAYSSELAGRLIRKGIPCLTSATAFPAPTTSDTISPAPKQELRKRWGLSGELDLAVALLSDHPALCDAHEAARVLLLGGITQVSRTNRRAALIIHPCQLNGRRARRLLAAQSSRMHVAQDSAITRPWSVLGACDVALALGPTHGGLSQVWAHQCGVPTITSPAEPGTEIASLDVSGRPPVRHGLRDLAHQLQQALVGHATTGIT